MIMRSHRLLRFVVVGFRDNSRKEVRSSMYLVFV